MSHRSSFRLTLIFGVALLSACSGGGSEDEKTVAMRDMEVVDGTASDAMTDLDGVQTQDIALPPAAGTTTPAPAAATGNSAAPAEEKAEPDVIADQ